MEMTSLDRQDLLNRNMHKEQGSQFVVLCFATIIHILSFFLSNSMGNSKVCQNNLCVGLGVKLEDCSLHSEPRTTSIHGKLAFHSKIFANLDSTKLSDHHHHHCLHK